MAGNLQCVLFFLVLVGSIDTCIGRGSLSSWSWPPPPTKAAPRPPPMPKKMFSLMMNVTTTDDFLQAMSMKTYKQEKKNGVLPSQIKVPMIKSRSSGGHGLPAGLVDFQPQPCLLRPHIHFLDQPPINEGAFVWPYAVKIPRCAGSCNVRHDIFQCRVETKVNASLQTYKVSYDRSSRKRRDVMEEFAKLKDPIHQLMKRSSNQNVQISTVKVEIHTSCKCECVVTKDICKKQNKVFVKDFCECECASVQQCKLPYRWDENQCKCVCGDDPVYMNNLCQLRSRLLKIWNPKTCSCECLRSTECSSKEKKFNKRDANCQCTCAVKSCPANQTLHFLGKKCYCK